MSLWSRIFGQSAIRNPQSAIAPLSIPSTPETKSFEDLRTPPPIILKSGAPFPFNKIMPYDATGGEHLNKAYSQSAWVQRAIKKISGPISAVDLNFTENGEDFSDPALEAFWDCPALRMSRADFIEATVGWLKLAGEAFWLMDDSSLPFPNAAGGMPLLVIARPDRMFLHHAGSLIEGWDYVDADGKHHGLLPEQVIQLKMWNPYDEFRGLAEMHSAKDAAEADFFAGKYAKNQFANNGDRGPFIIAKQGIPDDTQRQQIIDQIREKRELSQRGVYKPMFLNGDFTIEDPKVQAPDATFISARLENRHEIALAFGVPPSMFDVKASYSIGSASDWFMLISETCIPTGQKIAESINLVLRRQTGRAIQAGFNWDEHPVIQAVRRERADTAQKYFAMGVPLKILNDYLNLELPECPGWDKGYLPINLNAIGEPQENPATSPAYAEGDAPPDKAQVKASFSALKSLLGPAAQMKQLLNSSSVESVKSVVTPDFQKSRNPRETAAWKAHMAARRETVKLYLSKITKVLMQARAEVLKKLEARITKSAPSTSSTPSTPSIQKAVAGDFLFNLHHFTGQLFGVLRPVHALALETAGAQLYKELGIEDPFKSAPEAVLQFTKTRENMLANVPDEIHASIQTVIHDGLQNGDPIKKIADAVRAKFNQIDAGRAKTIAMTETAAAYGTGRDEAMKSAGVENKQWLTSGNDNVREAHQDANGQIVPVEKAFEVGGEDLRFPGDPDGSPENIINCHCVSIATAKPPTES
ncbi:MAG: phage portal protein [Verrucomicrobiota bacterium]|jgi:HK97 family phage portal protein